MTEFFSGIHKFLHLEDEFLCMVVHDSHSPPSPAYNQNKTVSLWGPSGRRLVSSYSYS